jgi:hypothetical protein
LGRSAPALSISEIDGRRFCSAMSDSRPDFHTLTSLIAPPLTVASLAVIRHSTPLTTPTPPTTLAPGGVAGHVLAGQRAQLEEVRVAIEQQLDALARQELAGGDVAAVVLVAAAHRGRLQRRRQLGDGRGSGLVVAAVLVALAIDVRAQDRIRLLGHGGSLYQQAAAAPRRGPAYIGLRSTTRAAGSASGSRVRSAHAVW